MFRSREAGVLDSHGAIGSLREYGSILGLGPSNSSAARLDGAGWSR
jgi:hypothetical protein